MAKYEFLFEKTTVQRAIIFVETNAGNEMASQLAKEEAIKKFPWWFTKETIEIIGDRKLEEPEETEKPDLRTYASPEAKP